MPRRLAGPIVAQVRNGSSSSQHGGPVPPAGYEARASPGAPQTGLNEVMTPFGKDFYRALAIGFLIGCAGMALSVNSAVVHAKATHPVAHATH
jgi:hypothetical protein